MLTDIAAGTTYTFIPVNVTAGTAAIRADAVFIIAVTAGRVAYNAPTVLPVVVASHTTVAAYALVPVAVATDYAANRADAVFIIAVAAGITAITTPAVLPVVIVGLHAGNVLILRDNDSSANTAGLFDMIPLLTGVLCFRLANNIIAFEEFICYYIIMSTRDFIFT